MKPFLSAAFAASLATVPGTGAQTTLSTARLQPTPSNLLGNGGVERWDLGNGFQGPIGPDLWYAMGDNSAVFTQGHIAFTRLEGCAPTSNGSVVMQIRANLPDNFVSQRVENFGEYAGEDVTFSISVQPLFNLAKARIEIDDGVSASEALIQVSMGQWGRVTVRHAVAACPTKLEFRIYPEQTVNVDDAMAVLGRFADAEFIPRPNPEPALREVPPGAVLDWYRFDASVPVPAGFAICDGSAVVDADSPFLGRATPNLSDRFVRGVTSTGSIGTLGGASSVNLSHTHSINHNHTVNYAWLYSLGPNPVPPVSGVNQHNGSSGSALGNVSTLPPFFGLLKIIRIK